MATSGAIKPTQTVVNEGEEASGDRYEFLRMCFLEAPSRLVKASLFEVPAFRLRSTKIGSAQGGDRH